jgi:ADP-ribosylglycohydrolase
MQFREREIACFKALATGDAIGKQTETLSRAGVRQWYPGVSPDSTAGPEKSSRYSGKRYEWRIGETTDDTEQTLAVARRLLREGSARHTVDRLQFAPPRPWPPQSRRRSTAVRSPRLWRWP